jgi:sn-glycerol 3-phosphate transport system permease protein
MARPRAGATILAHVVLAGTTFVVVFPVLYAVQVSTLGFQEVFVFPPRLTPGAAFVENFQRAWEKVHLGRLLLNSTLIAVTVALGKICLSVMAAFAFTYFRPFPGRTVLFVLVMITHMLPLPVRIVPTFQLMHDLGWVNSYRALTVPFFASATGTLLFRQFFLTIPPALSEAARVDGAGPLRFLVRILLPLSLNNLAALFLVEFLYMWNEYLWPLIITTSDDMRVVQVGIKMLVATDAQAEWNVIMAGVVAVMIPPLVVLVTLQRSFVRSIALGQEK